MPGKAPDARYPTALALAADLRRFLDGRPVQAHRLGTPQAARRWARRLPTAAALLLVVAVAAAGLTAGGLHYNARLRAVLGGAEAANAGLTAALAEADALRADNRRQLDDTRRALFAHQLAQLPALWPATRSAAAR